jgi:hypothetical protein
MPSLNNFIILSDFRFEINSSLQGLYHYLFDDFDFFIDFQF